MNAVNTPRFHRLPKLARVVRARPRLFLCGVIGILVGFALTGFEIAPRLLIGWDVAVGLYLATVYWMIEHSDMARMRRRAALQDEGRLTILALTVAAALASLAAIVVELGVPHGKAGRDPTQLALATLTIVLSWAFIHTIFALHYAHEFYDDDERGGGLAFPGGDRPDYWDFVYFSFVVGMTSQVSDVAVTGKAIRRTVTAHGAVSFMFNAALIALGVNIAASAI